MQKICPTYSKCTQEVKTFSSWADLLLDENIDHAEKKAQNSDVERGLLHGENDVIKFQILFCKYLCTTFLLQIFVSFRSVQLVPFSFPSWLRSVHFVYYKSKMRWKLLKYLVVDKTRAEFYWNIWTRIKLWNIWTRINWEGKFRNTDFLLSMGFN